MDNGNQNKRYFNPVIVIVVGIVIIIAIIIAVILAIKGMGVQTADNKLNENMVQQSFELDDNIKKLEQRLGELEYENKKLEEENKNLLDDKPNQQATELNDTIKRLEQRLDELELENIKLEKDNVSLLDEKTAQQSSELGDNKTELERRLEELELEYNKLKEDNINLSSTLESLKSADKEIVFSFVEKVPPYDVSHQSKTDSSASNDVRVRDSVIMAGITNEDVITYRVGSGANTGTMHSLHNLGGQYTSILGFIGRVDGTGEQKGTFNFYGDGKLIKTYKLSATDLPTTVELDVADVRQLKIEFIAEKFVPSTTYAFVGKIQ